ncbi:hypothetical protein PMAYCL1PPCAC_08997, partial [Pristionchus mayeri]
MQELGSKLRGYSWMSHSNGILNLHSLIARSRNELYLFQFVSVSRGFLVLHAEVAHLKPAVAALERVHVAL